MVVELDVIIQPQESRRDTLIFFTKLDQSSSHTTSKSNHRTWTRRRKRRKSTDRELTLAQPVLVPSLFYYFHRSSSSFIQLQGAHHFLKRLPTEQSNRTKQPNITCIKTKNLIHCNAMHGWFITKSSSSSNHHFLSFTSFLALFWDQLKFLYSWLKLLRKKEKGERFTAMCGLTYIVVFGQFKFKSKM